MLFESNISTQRPVLSQVTLGSMGQPLIRNTKPLYHSAHMSEIRVQLIVSKQRGEYRSH